MRGGTGSLYTRTHACDACGTHAAEARGPEHTCEGASGGRGGAVSGLSRNTSVYSYSRRVGRVFGVWCLGVFWRSAKSAPLTLLKVLTGASWAVRLCMWGMRQFLCQQDGCQQQSFRVVTRVDGATWLVKWAWRTGTPLWSVTVSGVVVALVVGCKSRVRRMCDASPQGDCFSIGFSSGGYMSWRGS